MKIININILLIIVVIIVISIGGFLWLMPPIIQEKQLDKMRIAVLPSMGYFVLEIGINRGFFKEIGVNIQLIDVSISQNIINGLKAGFIHGFFESIPTLVEIYNTTDKRGKIAIFIPGKAISEKHSDSSLPEILVIEQTFIQQHPGIIAKLHQAWDKSIAYIHNHPNEVQNYIANYLDLLPLKRKIYFSQILSLTINEQKKLAKSRIIHNFIEKAYKLSLNKDKKGGFSSEDFLVKEFAVIQE